MNTAARQLSGDQIVRYLDLKCEPLQGVADFERLFHSEVIKKPIILILDEFDALPEPVISSRFFLNL